MRKTLYISKRTPLIILGVLVGLIFMYTIYLNITAKVIGSEIGTSTGTMSGRAIGSLEGITKGRTEGSAAGKEAGLSAEDTAVKIADSIHEVENLEVLVASVKLSNCHKIGQNVDYAALYLVNGNLIFTVDLSQAVIQLQSDKLEIILPKPTGQLHIDNSSIEKVAEYQRTFFTGSAEAGFDAYLNTMAKVQEASENEITNYDSLLTSARKAAEEQVTLLAKAVAPTDREITINWAS